MPDGESKKPILGLLLSLIFPGLGHIYVKKKKIGLIFSLATISLFIIALISLSVYPSGVSIGLFVAVFILWIIQGWEAYLSVKHLSKDKTTKQFWHTKRESKKTLIEIYGVLKKIFLAIIDMIDWLIRFSFYANEKTKDLGEMMIAQKTLSKLAKDLDEEKNEN